MRTSDPRRPLQLLLPLFCLAVLGCDGSRAGLLTRTCVELGISDPPAPRPLTVDVLCDPTSGSPCTSGRLAETLDAILPAASRRPRSEIRLWLQGESVARTELILRVPVPEFGVHRRKARPKAEQSWVEMTRNAFARAATPAWTAQKPGHSPIAESLTKIAGTEGPRGSERLLLALTDGREVSTFGDFECRPLPSNRAFLAKLRKEALLSPQSFSGIRVLFAYLGPTPIGDRGCAVTVLKTETIKGLWNEALLTAGAKEVRFLALAPRLEDDDKEKGEPSS